MNGKAMNENIPVSEVFRDISEIQHIVNENNSAVLSGNDIAASDDEVLAVSQKLIEKNLAAYMKLAK